MDPLSALVGFVGGVVTLVAWRSLARVVAAAPTPAAVVPPPVVVPPPPAPAVVPPPAIVPPPPVVEEPAASPLPAASSSATPELEVVAYNCPRCGGDLDVQDGATRVQCGYCDAAVRVEGTRPLRPAAPQARPGKPERAPPFVPPREATLTGDGLGRFEVCVLRQRIHPKAREAMRFVPLDPERRAAVILLRVLDAGGGRSEQSPREDPALLDALARAAEESLRARRDPGLAVKAALRVLEPRGDGLMLEAFVAVLDAERSAVVTTNCGCAGALVHCSLEERRTIDASFDRGALDRLALRGNQEAFANRDPLALAAGDAVVVTSAALCGDGRGWGGGSRAVHEALRPGWTGRGPQALAVAVKDRYWEERAKGWKSEAPPIGDLLVVAVVVRSNADLRGAPAPLALPTRALETRLFDVVFAPAPSAFVATAPLAGGRGHALLWLESVEAKEAPAPGACEVAWKAVLETLDGKTGDNDNPRAAGRQALVRAGLAERADLRALCLFLGDQHGKLAFWTKPGPGAWRSPFDLLPRGDRGGSGQQFDEGGEHWPKAGGRLVFPGSLPFAERTVRMDDVATHWSGGKASALYEACLNHDDHATSAEVLATLWGAARVDRPDAPLDGAMVVGRKVEA